MGPPPRHRRPETEPDPLTDFRIRDFSYSGIQRPVYSQGEGPGVVVMHEVPGITPEVADFARHLVAAGYAVHLPLLFGEAGRPRTWGYMGRSLVQACIARELTLFGTRRSSEITVWLRALCRDVHSRCGGPGVGAVGMCLTGNFALAMMVEPALMAPVLSQPSLPIGFTPSSRRGLHLSDDELAQVKQRAAEGCPVLGLRFRADLCVPSPRFARLHRELGDAFRDVTLDLNGHDCVDPMPHSVLTTEHRPDVPGHPTQRAMAAVLDLFAERLHAPPGAAP